MKITICIILLPLVLVLNGYNAIAQEKKFQTEYTISAGEGWMAAKIGYKIIQESYRRIDITNVKLKFFPTGRVIIMADAGIVDAELQRIAKINLALIN